MEERWRTYIDRIIEEARERGEFDPPDFKGKRLTDDPSEVHAGDRAMAHKVLSNSGHAPPFLMKKREIDAALEKERERLRRYARRRRRLLAEAATAETPERAAGLRTQADADWLWAVRQVEAALPAINEQIELFNLMNPIPSMFRRKVQLDREIERIEAELDAGEA